MLTPGQILQKRRLELRKSVSQVSQETKIQERYIKLLESDDYTPFASDIYISGFLKIYSEYLGLDIEKMLALYRRVYINPDVKTKKRSIKSRMRFTGLKNFITPLNIVIAVVLIAIFGFIVFTVTQYNQLQQVPKLAIESPRNNTETTDEKIIIKGSTDKDVVVVINEDEIRVSNNSFSKEYQLKEGDNIFTIKAENTNTELKTIKTIRVTRIQPKVIEKPKEEVKTLTYSAYVQVTGETSWVQLVVDNQQKLAQVINPGNTQKYPVTKNLQFITGKPTITKLFINDKEVKLYINPANGVATVSCTIENNTLNCPN